MEPKGFGYAAAAAAPAPDMDGLQRALQVNPGPERISAELAKLFRVRRSEVALMRLEHGTLKFLSPPELATAGSIPLSSSTAVAARTAGTKKVEIFNGFTKVKHAGIFEKVKLGKSDDTDQADQSERAPIQKLISCPILDPQGKVLGVLQVSRKAFDPPSAGPDFTLDDAQFIERIAEVLAQAAFLQPSK
jgi:hypothetical protein